MIQIDTSKKGKYHSKAWEKNTSENYLVYQSKNFREMCGICAMMQEHVAPVKAGAEIRKDSGWDRKPTEWDKNGFG